MTARNNILNAIGSNKPAFIPAPPVMQPANAIINKDLVTAFIATLKSIGGIAVVTADIQIIKEKLDHFHMMGNQVVNTVPGIRNYYSMHPTDNATALENIYIACIAGGPGVAENGAVWVDEKQMVNRLLPFICQHLCIVLNADDIVKDLHEAYAKIDIDKEGYGAFIAGPSKTADIEQSLVIGAHGARSCTVYILTPSLNSEAEGPLKVN